MQRADHVTAVEHYNQHVGQMQNQPWFYEWVLKTWDVSRISPSATICDVGCGTGELLAQLQARGYRHVHGADFAPACVAATHQRVPAADVFVHDIQQAPLPTQFDVLIMTGVIDFLPDPAAALRNVSNSLKPGGRVLISIRNRNAYWPWYHLRGLARYLPSPRLKHWFLWFSTPLGLRRADQPHEHVYSIAEARALLAMAGLKPTGEYGYYCLPMLWIPEFPTLIRCMRRLDAWSRHLPGSSRYYFYLFVCTRDGA